MAWSTRFTTSVGPAGVDLFFIISGFVIYTIAVRSFGSELSVSSRVMGFGLARILRIYPLYWIVFIAASAEIYHAGGGAYLYAKWEMSRAGLFLFSRQNEIVPVAWSLAYEIYFYAVVTCLLLAGGRWFKSGFLIWALAQAAIIVVFHHSPTYLIFNPQMLEFLMGVVIAEIVSRGSLIYFPRASIFFGLFMFLIGGVFALRITLNGNPYGLDNIQRVIWYGIPAALVIYGVVALEPAGFNLPRWLKRVGDASYSLYLTHLVVLAVTQQLARYWHIYDHIPRPLFAVALFLICIISSRVVYRLFEHPLHVFSRRLAAAIEEHFDRSRRSRQSLTTAPNEDFGATPKLSSTKGESQVSV
jgi:peptidoglycan/LPS O-acetylase OafA/YrhL